MKEVPATGAWQKAFDYNYLGTYIIPLDKQQIDVVIKKITDASDAKVQGKTKKVRLIYFNEFEKPMILNKVNSGILDWNFGVRNVEHWIGRKATLFADPDVDAFGVKVEGLRFVKNKERGKFTPAGQMETKAKLDITSPNFDTIASWLVEKEERTVEAICAKYDVTPAAKEALIKKKHPQ